VTDEDLPDYCNDLAALLRRRAFQLPPFDGRDDMMFVVQAARFDDDRLALRLIFTRDTGHHTSGWFKNPDYERCLHLSISPAALAPRSTCPDRDPPANIEQLLVPAFFGAGARFAWRESPKSPEGKASRVQHWRVFCDHLWHPIVPRKEVYSRDFTEKGWKSASELGIRIDSPLTT
jgi:hypothetical protein